MKKQKWLNTIVFLIMVAINALANILKFGGNTTGSVSDIYPNLFTPAPITFAIWGVIYLLIGLFILRRWGLFGSKKNAEYVSESIGSWFAISCVFNSLWILCWHFDKIGLSVVCMLGLLVSLILINTKIKIPEYDSRDYWLMNSGLEIYFGWIIAATIANVSVLLVKINWNRFGLSEATWTAVMLAVGTIIATLVVLFRHKVLVGIAVIWAYFGILFRQLSSSQLSGKYPLIIAVDITCIVIISIFTVLEIYNKRSDNYLRLHN